MDIEGKNVLVLGGAGFVGSYITELLLKEDANVVVYDNFSRGSLENLKNVKDNSNLKIITGDILDKEKLNNTMRNIDIVYNEVALWFSDCEANPAKCIETNFNGLFNALECAVSNNVKKVIFASSASLYGTPEYLPFDEKHPMNDLSFYSTTKIAGERLLKSFNKKYNLNYIVLRYMNIYGPRQDYRRDYTGIVMKTIRSVCNGDKPIIYGSGKQTMDLTYVEDIARANVLVAKSDLPTGVFNISTNKETSVNDLVSEIINRIDSSIIPEYKTTENELIGRRVASYDLAKNCLGYVPQVSLNEGLSKTIEWYENEKINNMK